MKRALILIMVLAMIFSVTSVSASGAEGAPLEITYWHCFGGEAAEMTDRLVESFNANNPGIHVTPVFIDSANFIAKSIAATVAGNPPDAACAIHQRVPSLKNDLVPLDDFMSNDTSFERDAMYDYFWDILEIDGKVMSLPYETTNLGILYNQDLLDAAGVEVPKTWDELRDAALKLTDASQKQYGLLYWLGTDPFWSQPFLWQNGAEFMNEYDLNIRFDAPESVEALKFLASLVEDGSVPLSPPENGFLSGKVAMVFSGPWEVPAVTKNATFNWGAAPLPSNKESATNIGGTTLFIYKTTEERQKASWEFLKYLTSPAGVEEMIGIGWLPIRSDVAESAVWQDKLAEMPQLQVFMDQMAVGRMRPFGDCYEEVSVMYSNAVNEVLYGVKDAETAMAEATEAAYDIFRQAGKMD